MDNKLVKLAKGNAKKPSIPTKKPVVKVVEKPKTPEEERDIKAKQKVDELIGDIEFNPKKNVVVEPTTEQRESTEWLTEQVALLSEENEILRNEAEVAKSDYAKLFEQFQNRGGNGTPNELLSETYTQNVLMIFNELQANMLGLNQERTPWVTVNISHVLNQLLMLFPFTENYKKF